MTKYLPTFLLLASGLLVATGSASSAGMDGMGAMHARPSDHGDFAKMQRAMDRMMTTTGGATSSGDTDRDFMRLMIPHHQAAIDMATVELRSGKRPEVRALARAIVRAQTAEIAQMRRLLQK